MMSRQDGYKHRSCPMRNMETDIDGPERQRTPSPAPLQLSNIPKYSPEDEERSEEINGHDDNPPRTPYYDYTCTCWSGKAIDVCR